MVFNIFKRFKSRHAFHLVDPSPWPLTSSIAALVTAVGAVMYFHSHFGGEALLFAGLIATSFSMGIWWRDVIREGTFEGYHTGVVQEGLRNGFILFIVSEVMFFFAFFWAFFSASFCPTIEVGAIWPPKGIECFSPWEVPALNTLILLLSGASVTWCHHAVVAGKQTEAIFGLVVTIILAAIFTGFQLFEYASASFSISDGIYGSTFYMATGFHGFHVFIGTVFLSVCLARLLNFHFATDHHIGLEAAIWYWHFVDVVWLFLFIAVYWWGGA
jgi:heme/copper-type cytochrome/quinol oxidase subunit 3